MVSTWDRVDVSISVDLIIHSLVFVDWTDRVVLEVHEGDWDIINRFKVDGLLDEVTLEVLIWSYGLDWIISIDDLVVEEFRGQRMPC